MECREEEIADEWDAGLYRFQSQAQSKDLEK